MFLIGSVGKVQQEGRSAQRTIETVVALASTTDYQFAPRRCISCRKERLVNDVGDDGDEQDDSYVDADHDEGADGDATQKNKITRRSEKNEKKKKRAQKEDKGAADCAGDCGADDADEAEEEGGFGEWYSF